MHYLLILQQQQLCVCALQRKRQQLQGRGASGLCVFEGADGEEASSAVLDFCGASAAQQILVGMQPAKDRKTAGASRGERREAKFSKVKVNKEGKIVIEEEDEEDDSQQQKGAR